MHFVMIFPKKQRPEFAGDMGLTSLNYTLE